jgi:hypothetical protein
MNTLNFRDQVCRAVPGFPGYWVPASGDFIVSTRKRNHGDDCSPKALRLTRDKDGYSENRSGLVVDGKQIRLRLHEAVLLAWVGPRTGPVARHLDDDKNNNSVKNLVWGTHLENGADRRLFGTSQGERNPAAKMTEAFVLKLREEGKTATLGELRKRYPDFSKFALWAAVSGYTWAHLPGAVDRNRRCSRDGWRAGQKLRQPKPARALPMALNFA